MNTGLANYSADKNNYPNNEWKHQHSNKDKSGYRCNKHTALHYNKWWNNTWEHSVFLWQDDKRCSWQSLPHTAEWDWQYTS
jgi:hypothetical protein